MEVVFERCAGIDVHKRTAVVCRITPGERRQPVAETRTFGTTTAELLQLSDWLSAGGCTHVGLESTGVYWRPIHNLLEGSFEVWLLNAQHIKAVPGRKTDVKDAQWIAELLRHGLVRPSFIPPRHQRDLRELTRHRTSFVQQRATLSNRVQKVLEGANITDELACQGVGEGSLQPWRGVRSRGTAPHARNHSAGTPSALPVTHCAGSRRAGCRGIRSVSAGRGDVKSRPGPADPPAAGCGAVARSALPAPTQCRDAGASVLAARIALA